MAAYMPFNQTISALQGTGQALTGLAQLGAQRNAAESTHALNMAKLGTQRAQIEGQNRLGLAQLDAGIADRAENRAFREKEFGAQQDVRTRQLSALDFAQKERERMSQRGTPASFLKEVWSTQGITPEEQERKLGIARGAAKQVSWMFDNDMSRGAADEFMNKTLPELSYKQYLADIAAGKRDTALGRVTERNISTVGQKTAEWLTKGNIPANSPTGTYKINEGLKQGIAYQVEERPMVVDATDETGERIKRYATPEEMKADPTKIQHVWVPAAYDPQLMLSGAKLNIFESIKTKYPWIESATPEEMDTAVTRFIASGQDPKVLPVILNEAYGEIKKRGGIATAPPYKGSATVGATTQRLGFNPSGIANPPIVQGAKTVGRTLGNIWNAPTGVSGGW